MDHGKNGYIKTLTLELHRGTNGELLAMTHIFSLPRLTGREKRKAFDVSANIRHKNISYKATMAGRRVDKDFPALMKRPFPKSRYPRIYMTTIT